MEPDLIRQINNLNASIAEYLDNPNEHRDEILSQIAKFRQEETLVAGDTGREIDMTKPPLDELLKLVEKTYENEYEKNAAFNAFAEGFNALSQEAQKIMDEAREKEAVIDLGLDMMLDVMDERDYKRTKWEDKKSRLESEVLFLSENSTGVITQDGLNKIAEKAVVLGLELAIKNVQEKPNKNSKDSITISMDGNKYKIPIKFENDEIKEPSI